MTAEAVRVGQAVVDELNTTTWGLAFTAARRYAPRFQPDELDDLQVSVLVRRCARSRATRASSFRKYTVDIALQQRAADDAAADAVLLLAEQIADRFEPLPRLFEAAQVEQVLQATDLDDDLYDVEHLRQWNIVTTVVRLVVGLEKRLEV